MKKTLIALAALASTAAFAQSTVNLTGTLGYGYTKGSTTAKAAWGQTDGNLVFTAVEDLGGGLKATARAQLDINGVRGGSANSADRSISLAGGFGTVTLANGRSGNAAVSAAGISGASLDDDAWGDAGGTRVAVNGVTYTSPALIPGLTVSASMLQLGTAAYAAGVNSDVGLRNTTVSAQYAAGPLTAGITLKKNSGLSTASATELNAGYDLGVARVAFGYVKPKTGDARTGLGVSAPFGPVTVGFGYIKSGSAKYWDAAAAYSLSKRTALSVSLGKADAAKENQYRIKVQHSF